MRLALLLALLAAFSAYTLLVMVNHGGPLGFIAHAAEHAWGFQMLLDLIIMLESTASPPGLISRCSRSVHQAR